MDKLLRVFFAGALVWLGFGGIAAEQATAQDEAPVVPEESVDPEEKPTVVKDVPEKFPQASTDLDNSKESSTGEIQTLEQALVAAYNSNSDIQAKRQELRMAEEQIVQAKSGYRPRLNLEGNLSLQDQIFSGNTKDQSRQPGYTGSQGSFGESKTASGSLKLSQNIFKGGETAASVAMRESQREAARLELIALEQKTFVDTIRAYLSLLSVSAEVRLYQANVKTLEETLKASQEKFKVGEETRTSVAQAEAQLADFQARLESKKADLEAARADFVRLTNIVPGKLTKPTEFKNLPAALEASINRAMTENPAVLAAKFAVEAAVYGIDVEVSGLLPRIDLEGSSTYSRVNSKSNAPAYAPLRGRSLDNTTTNMVGIRISVPLYEGGEKRSRIRSAHDLSEQKRIEHVSKCREVKQEDTKAWYYLEAAKANLVHYRKQVEAQSVSLEGTRQEMAVGTKILVDVLEEQRKLVQAEQNLVGAERDYYVSGYQLMALMGYLTVPHLGLPIKEYDANAHYDEVTNKW